MGGRAAVGSSEGGPPETERRSVCAHAAKEYIFTYATSTGAASAWLYTVNQTTTAFWSMHTLSLDGCAQHTNHKDRTRDHLYFQI